LVAELPVKVVLVMLGEEDSLYIPPPLYLGELVLDSTVMPLPATVCIPPAYRKPVQNGGSRIGYGEYYVVGVFGVAGNV
jgi:hypothetical protein